MKNKYTPTPYKVVKIGSNIYVEPVNPTKLTAFICDMQAGETSESYPQAESDAAFIVKACNNHTALVEALKYPRYGDTATLLEKVADNLEHLAGPGHTSIFTNHLLNAAKQMRAALKAVEDAPK